MWSYKGLTGYAAVKQADADLNPAIPDFGMAAAALNQLTQTVTTPDVQIVKVTEYLRNAGRADGSTAWLAIVAAAASGNGAAKGAIDYNSDVRTVTLNLNSPVVQNMMQALVTSNVITSAEAAGVAALANSIVPVFDSPRLDAGHIQTARAQ